MRPKTSEPSLPSEIPILFIIKRIQRRGKSNSKLAELPFSVFYLGKGSISLWSIFHSGFPSVSPSLLFQLQAAILDRHFPLETGMDPAAAGCPS